MGGAISGSASLANLLGIATLAYPGPLQEFLPTAVGLALVGISVGAVIAALFATLRGTIIESQEAPALLLGFLGVTAWQALPPELQGAERAAVVFALYASVTVLCGLIFLGLGSARLGYLIRYVPFSVIGGVLASLGALLVIGAIHIAAGPDGVSFDALTSDGDLDVRLAIMLVFALVYWVTSTRVSDAMIPVALVLGVLLLYGGAAVIGIPTEMLSAEGWLLGPFPTDSLLASIDFTGLGHLDWTLILDLAPAIAPIVIVATLGVLLHSTALELALRRDVDVDRDLQACGAANIAGGLLGGLPSFHCLSDMLLLEKMQARNALAPYAAVLIWVVALFFGASLIGTIPRAAVSGLVMFMGLLLLKEWLWDGYRRLPFGEWLVIAAITLTTVLVGYLEGLALGAFAGIVMFQIGYSRIEVVRLADSASTLRSSIERSAAQGALLDREGDAILVMKLSGFAFFGTAHNIVRRIRRYFHDRSHRRGAAIVLDLRRLDGMDWACINSLTKLVQFAERHDIALVLAEPAPQVRATLQRSRLAETHAGTIRIVDAIDDALEWCEERLLRAHDIGPGEVGTADGEVFPEWIRRQIPDRDMRNRLRDRMEAVTYKGGETMMSQGEPADSLLVICGGRASVHIRHGDTTLRVKSYAAGTVVGEVAFYRGGVRTATVRADSEVQALMLRRAAMDSMVEAEPALAAALDRATINLLSERLDSANQLLSKLMR